MEKQQLKIIYFYDALCGWCFGFSPVMEEIRWYFKETISFEIVSGGLKLAEEAGPIGVVAPYIKEGAYKIVENQCGVKFGQAFCEGPLQEGTMVLNSEPPAIALAIVKEQVPDKAFEFGAILHKAVYVDGMHPEDIESYGSYAASIGIAASDFLTWMKSKRYLEAAHDDFERTKRNGVSAFPTLIAQQNDSSRVLSRGYQDFETLKAAILRLAEF